MKKRKEDSGKRSRGRPSGRKGSAGEKRSATRFFGLGAGASPRTILTHLRKAHRLGVRRQTICEFSYYDTFGWRVHARGRRVSLQRENSRYRLTLKSLGRDDTLTLVVDKPPSFASELPRGRMRRELERVVGVRRLLPVADVEVRSDHYAVLDEVEKTVVRLVFDRGRVRDPRRSGDEVQLQPTLRVVRLRGYRRAYDELLDQLSERSGLEPISMDLEDRALACLGLEPQFIGSGLDVQLDADAPTGAAFVTIHRALFEAMKRNEPGIRADLDTEFLHEFRVAARRARVLHRVFRELIRDSEFADLAERIRWLRNFSGPTRDLDVQLLELSKERDELGEELDALIPLESLLREHRHAAWEKLINVLDSPEYATLRERASAFLDLPESKAAQRMSEQGPPLGPWASQHIARSARNLLKRGRRIDADSPDAMLHALRLEGKRLRYLLEFFSSLYPGAKVGALIRELRKLQDNLGDFNDACVRADLLRELATELAKRGPASTDALVAVGRLVERAAVRRAAARAAFAHRFERFDAPANRRRLRTLFGSGKKRSATSEHGGRAKAKDGEVPGAGREGDGS